MKYLHTMVRVNDLDKSLEFYCEHLGLKQLQRRDFEEARFSLVFLAAEGDEEAEDVQPEVQRPNRVPAQVAHHTKHT